MSLLKEIKNAEADYKIIAAVQRGAWKSSGFLTCAARAVEPATDPLHFHSSHNSPLVVSYPILSPPLLRPRFIAGSLLPVFQALLFIPFS